MDFHRETGRIQCKGLKVMLVFKLWVIAHLWVTFSYLLQLPKPQCWLPKNSVVRYYLLGTSWD